VVKPSVELLQGTLDVLILKTLSWGPMHGYGITRWIQRITDDVLRIEEGSMYPALYRMENRGFVKADWAITENKRRAKYYRLTAAGRKRLAEDSATWSLFSQAVFQVLRATEQPG
jgi:PadR family transcriptional regulator PadR